MKEKLLQCFICGTFTALCAFASQQPTGTLKGVVSDSQEAVIPQAVITIKNTARTVEFKSNEVGEFESNLPAGEYEVTIEWPGFKPFNKKDVQIPAAGVVNFNVTLQVVSTIHSEPFITPERLEVETGAIGDKIEERLNLPTP